MQIEAAILDTNYDEMTDVLTMYLDYVIDDMVCALTVTVYFAGEINIRTTGEWLTGMRLATEAVRRWDAEYNANHAGDSPVCVDLTGERVSIEV